MTELKVKLDAIAKLRRPGANGNTTGSFRYHQGGLSRYVVTLHQERGDKFQLVFERLAEDHDHAVLRSEIEEVGVKIGCYRMPPERDEHFKANKTLGNMRTAQTRLLRIV